MVDMATKLQTKKEKERERGKEGRKGERWRGERREETAFSSSPDDTHKETSYHRRVLLERT